MAAEFGAVDDQFGRVDSEGTSSTAAASPSRTQVARGIGRDKEDFATAEKRKCFIGNLSWDTSEASFERYFSQFGAVESVDFKRTIEGHPRGFAFVVFRDRAVADLVLKSELVVDGRKVDATVAVPRTGIPSHAKASAAPTRVKRLYVGRVPDDASEEELRGIFSVHGSVYEVVIMKERESHKSRGFCFVTFDTEDDAERAFQARESILLRGQSLEIRMAEPKRAVAAQGAVGGDRRSGGYEERESRGHRGGPSSRRSRSPLPRYAADPRGDRYAPPYAAPYAYAQAPSYAAPYPSPYAISRAAPAYDRGYDPYSVRERAPAYAADPYYPPAAASPYESDRRAPSSYAASAYTAQATALYDSRAPAASYSDPRQLPPAQLPPAPSQYESRQPAYADPRAAQYDPRGQAPAAAYSDPYYAQPSYAPAQPSRY